MATKTLKRQAKYEVLTLDPELDEYTPQKGMVRFYYGFRGLRLAIRRLRELGYTGAKGDPCVRLDRIQNGREKLTLREAYGSDIENRRAKTTTRVMRRGSFPR